MCVNVVFENLVKSQHGIIHSMAGLSNRHVLCHSIVDVRELCTYKVF